MRQGRRPSNAERTMGVIMFAWLIAPLGCQPRVTPETITVTASDWAGEGLSGRTLRTDHFEIHSTLSDSDFEEALPVFLEAAYAQFQRIAPVESANTRRLPVYVFGNRRQWHHFSRRRFPAHYEAYSTIQSGGFTESDTAVLFYSLRDATLAAIAHEAWHQYANTRLGAALPSWLNEGLACYHETFRYFGNTPVFLPRRNAFRMNTLCEMVQSDEILSLQDLLDFDIRAAIKAGDTKQSHLYYAQVWALVTFLKEGAQGRYRRSLKQILTDVADGTFRARVSAAALTHDSSARTSPGSSAFHAYFQAPRDRIGSEYYDFMVRTCGF